MIMIVKKIVVIFSLVCVTAILTRIMPGKEISSQKCYPLKISGEIGLFSEPFDQIKKIRTFLMQNRPMAYNIFYCDLFLQLILHTLPLVILCFLLCEVL